MSNLIAKEYKCFEDIKHIKEDGTEYWFARELATVLDYNKWENFNKVIKRAMIACENSGHDITYDFPEIRKIVKAGATQKPVLDAIFQNAGYIGLYGGLDVEYCRNQKASPVQGEVGCVATRRGCKWIENIIVK